mgnify:CR=1 FL=1
MQFLEETRSNDGVAVAKIYDDGDGGYLVEKWIDGNLQGSVPTLATIAEVRDFARQWVSSIGLLNG